MLLICEDWNNHLRDHFLAFCDAICQSTLILIKNASVFGYSGIPIHDYLHSTEVSIGA